MSLRVVPSPSPDPDALVLTRAQRGDREAQGALIARYERPVFALLGRMLVGRAHDVEDLAQDTFIKVLRALPSFDPHGAARLSTWILTIATRTCIDALRTTRPTVELPPLASEQPSLESQTERRALAARVQHAMATLSDEHRAVLVLRAYHDFDYPDIAAALGVPPGTVKSRLARAREALRGALESPHVR